MPIKKRTHGTRNVMPQPQTLVHDLTAEVEIAIFEADFFADLLIQLERQGLRAIEELQLDGQEFHASGGEVGVHRPARTFADPSFDADHELIAQPLRFPENLRRIGVEHHLQQPLAIAEVHENDSAMVPPPVNPSGHLDRLADQLVPNLSTVV